MKSAKRQIIYRRNLTVESQLALDQFGTLTAETIWAWNRLHSILMALFASLLNDDPKQDHIASAIWHIFQSDSSQRELLWKVASARLGAKSEKYLATIWLTKAIDKIAPYRNSIVHVPLVFQPTKPGRPNNIAIDIGGARELHLRRLELAGSSKRFWRAISGDLMVLSQFALALSGRSTDEVGESFSPSLRKPQLLTPRLFQEIDARLNPQQQNAKPKRPPKPSRG